MADPVGYVEAHGGVVGFGQRVLMPSTAPMPAPARLTPTPAPLTPIPGSIPGSFIGGYNTGTPVPTTLGAAAGQVQPAGKSKAGFVIAGIAIVAAAAVAIAFVMKSGKSNGGEVAANGSGGGSSAVVAGSAAGTSGSATVAITPRAGSAVAATGSAAGTAVVANGSGSAAGSAAVVASGSGSAAGSAVAMVGSAGSAGSAAGSAVPAPTTVHVKFTSSPSGAEIFIDGLDQNKATPVELDLPRGDAEHKVTLKAHGFADLDRKMQFDDSTSVDVELTRVGGGSKVTTGGTRPPGTGAKNPGTKTPGTKPPGTKNPGTKNNGGGDNLMNPDDL
jgi:hypothetical protein